MLGACLWGGVSQCMVQSPWGILLCVHGLLFLLVSLGAVFLSSLDACPACSAPLNWPLGAWSPPSAPAQGSKRGPELTAVCAGAGDVPCPRPSEQWHCANFQTNTGLWCNTDPWETPKPCCVCPSAFGGRQAGSKPGQVTWSLLTTQAAVTYSCGPDMK